MTIKNEELAQLQQFHKSGILTDKAHERAIKQLELNTACQYY